jgi:uncharacterized protein YggT (Ycf19 family)
MFDILDVFIQLVEIVMLVYFVMKLVDPTGNHRVIVTLKPIVEPILTPLRAMLPANQLDYSPLVVVLVLNILRWVFSL